MDNNKKDRSGAIGCITGIVCFVGFILLMLLIEPIVENHNEELYDRIGDSGFPAIYLIAAALISFGLIPWLFLKRARDIALVQIDWNSINRRIIEIIKAVDSHEYIRVKAKKTGQETTIENCHLYQLDCTFIIPDYSPIMLICRMIVDDDSFADLYGNELTDKKYSNCDFPYPYPKHEEEFYKLLDDGDVFIFKDYGGAYIQFHLGVSDPRITIYDFKKHLDSSNPYIRKVLGSKK